MSIAFLLPRLPSYANLKLWIEAVIVKGLGFLCHAGFPILLLRPHRLTALQSGIFQPFVRLR
jgi:hypothetical protein